MSLLALLESQLYFQYTKHAVLAHAVCKVFLYMKCVMHVFIFLPNSLAHMCSRIASVFTSWSQGGQTGEYPEKEKMLSVAVWRNSQLASKSTVIVTKLLFFPFFYVKVWHRFLESLQLTFRKQ